MTQADCPHDALNFTMPFPKPEAWASLPFRPAFLPSYPTPRTQVRCEDCGKEIDTEGLFTEQGMQAIVDAFGAIWKERLEDEAHKGAIAFMEWHKQYAARQQKGPKG